MLAVYSLPIPQPATQCGLLMGPGLNVTKRDSGQTWGRLGGGREGSSLGWLRAGGKPSDRDMTEVEVGGPHWRLETSAPMHTGWPWQCSQRIHLKLQGRHNLSIISLLLRVISL
jgi:hypothetical protein